MKRIPDLSVEVDAGGRFDAISCTPIPPYSPQAVAFLAHLSKALLAHQAIRLYPDIAAFGYWCRRANLARLACEFGDRRRRLGRGLALHIAPANVPVNFAFSFAFGVLAGNANIVRIPDHGHPQVDVICAEIRRLFNLSEHREIAAMNRIIRYPRNDEITAALSAICDARLLWGGDETITHLRSMRTSPRCVDIAFADRYSLCLLGVEDILAASEHEMEALAAGFYNDVFLLDQNACSSPHLILWKGRADRAEAAIARFWESVEGILRTKGSIPPVHAVDQYVHLCRTAISLPASGAVTRHENRIYRVRLQELPPDIEEYRGQHGFFFEHVIDSLNVLKAIVNARYQTLTCYGVDRVEIARFIAEEGLTGIDRVVPVGKALDMGVIWDGYDLIGTLSRVISDQ